MTFKGDTTTLAKLLIHTQFRCHPGCHICDLHLRSIMTREDELTVLGVSEIGFFRSTPEEFKEHTSYLPFPCIANPTEELYRKLGTEESQGFADGIIWRVSGLHLWAIA